jgi:glutamine amidotransferase
MSHVAIVDYGMGNLDSVARAVEECGGRPRRAVQPRDLDEAAHIILPGVGAFGNAMEQLESSGLVDALDQAVRGRGVPFLGVCLGMQLLATRSLEGGEHLGLGWIDAQVRRFDLKDSSLRIPHVGWNEVYPQAGSPLFAGIDRGRDFYFVHSYHVVCEDSSDTLATTPYGQDFCCAIQHENIHGVQFHPEKSQAVGLHLIRNFLAM